MMTKDEHIKIHKGLHKALDELVADFIGHNKDGEYLPSKVSVMRLMQWSAEQTVNPVG